MADTTTSPAGVTRQQSPTSPIATHFLLDPDFSPSISRALYRKASQQNDQLTKAERLTSILKRAANNTTFTTDQQSLSYTVPSEVSEAASALAHADVAKTQLRQHSERTQGQVQGYGQRHQPDATAVAEPASWVAL